MLALTYLDTNSWLIEWAGQRILLDPWFVGPLTFGDMPWLFKAERLTPREFPANIDQIVLSQGLPDHAHVPTLETCDRAIPVIASPSAAKIATDLGFQMVHALEHGQQHEVNTDLIITAVPGSPVGPNLLENGYVFSHRGEQTKLYYEPHGYHSAELDAFAPLDVVITPLIDLKLPLVGTVIGGQARSLQLAQRVQPQVMLPTAAGGDVQVTGLLNRLLKAEGSVERFRASLQAQGLAVQVLEPQPWQRFEVVLPESAMV
ncbi:MAG: MBL fold metallo-hydrolase [Spirulina sp. SIO3F2]|nr:MBL fold metallo-hydrolase [Spirulina sp. SIO3F2]